jgi:hypothetical protein
MKKNILIFTVALFVLGCFTQCKQDDYTLIGTWKSQDNNETMRVADGVNLYSAFSGGPELPFTYKLSNDSITLQYCGESFAAVLPTKHKYLLSRDYLTIDYSNYQGGQRTIYKRIK